MVEKIVLEMQSKQLAVIQLRMANARVCITLEQLYPMKDKLLLSSTYFSSKDKIAFNINLLKVIYIIFFGQTYKKTLSHITLNFSFLILCNKS